MALADYYARGAVAASQVLAGFDEQRFRATLEGVRVGITFGVDVRESQEGRALLDLLVRLLGRLYPAIVFNAVRECETLSSELTDLARRINPSVDLGGEPTIEVVVGNAAALSPAVPHVFVGSNGWDARVSSTKPCPVSTTANPFGAGVAACLAAANVFRLVFLGSSARADLDVTLSALELRPGPGPRLELAGSMGAVVLVGTGAIGNATAWALSRVQLQGKLHLVDHETIDLGNLQRYVLAERSDESVQKVSVVASHFNGALATEQHPCTLAAFLSSRGYSWPRMLLALDSAHDRRAAQASLPRWVANAWTQPGDLGVSIHDFLRGACVSCLYLPERVLENEDGVVATSLGVPDRLMQVRALLHTGQGVPRDLLQAIADGRGLPLERLLPFEGRPVRTLYVEGFCGGAVIPLGGTGAPRQEVHVPLAHQSALAGVFLAAAVVRDALSRTPEGTQVTRIDLLGPVPEYMTQPAAKDPRGVCICQDRDYRDVYALKYGLQVPGDSEPSTRGAGIDLDGVVGASKLASVT